jgi:competence protein ComGC
MSTVAVNVRPRTPIIFITASVRTQTEAAASMKKNLSQRAFTLIELLLVFVLMSLMTLVFLLNQNKFDSATIMRSTAYSVALSFRQAQVYGTSVLQNTPGTFAPAYGLYFDTAQTRQYTLFADQDNNGKFSTAAGDRAVRTFTLSKAYSIVEFCAIVSTLTRRCNGVDDTAGSSGTISTMTVFFKRPNPDAFFAAYQADGNPISGDVYSLAFVELQSNNGDTRIIKVTPTGQITVCAATLTGSGATQMRRAINGNC